VNTTEWLETLVFAASIDPGLAAAVEPQLAELESAAATTAVPTPHAHDAMASCRASGRSVAVVSNNSAVAVRAYLEAHDLARQVATVAARTEPDSAIFKSGPYLIKQVGDALDAPPSACAVVGGFPTDIRAAHSAGALNIGCANKSGEHERMTQAGAGTVVNNMADLTLILRAQATNPDM
jgi:beta-phosphoglucomutase-like phosphatase (HAD superfamily)